VGVMVGDDLVVFDEHLSHDTRAMAKWIVSHYGVDNVVVHPDASGGARSTQSSVSDIDILKSYGLLVVAPRANPLVKNRINSVNTAFYHGHLFVDKSRCPDTVRALELHSYDARGNPEKFPGAGTVDDHNDALGYLVHSVMPISKPSYDVYKY